MLSFTNLLSWSCFPVIYICCHCTAWLPSYIYKRSSYGLRLLVILKLKGILDSWEQEGPFSITIKDTQPGVYL